MKTLDGFDTIVVEVDEEGLLSIRQQDTCTGEEDVICIPFWLVEHLIATINSACAEKVQS